MVAATHAALSCADAASVHGPTTDRHHRLGATGLDSFAQVAIVTGGADGLGKGITARLASEGAKVRCAPAPAAAPDRTSPIPTPCYCLLMAAPCPLLGRPDRSVGMRWDWLPVPPLRCGWGERSLCTSASLLLLCAPLVRASCPTPPSHPTPHTHTRTPSAVGHLAGRHSLAARGCCSAVRCWRTASSWWQLAAFPAAPLPYLVVVRGTGVQVMIIDFNETLGNKTAAAFVADGFTVQFTKVRRDVCVELGPLPGKRCRASSPWGGRGGRGGRRANGAVRAAQRRAALNR